MSQTAILGAGVMGETLLSGLVRAGRRVDHLLVGEKRSERAHELEERYGVAVVGNVEAATKGEKVRVYVPYGTEWYGYLMRRLAERPQNLSFFVRSLISKK